MPLHRDIHWLGRQWAVTGHGLQLINQKQMGYYDIEVARLWEPGVVEAMQGKAWINRPDFDKAVEIARSKFAEAAPPGTPPPTSPATPSPPARRAPAEAPSVPALEELLARLKSRSASLAPAATTLSTPGVEPLQAEAFRSEAFRREVLEAEARRAEALEAEALRAEAFKAEALKAAAAAEALKAEALKAETCRAEAVKAEALRDEALKAEALRDEALKAEALGVEAAEAAAVRPPEPEPRVSELRQIVLAQSLAPQPAAPQPVLRRVRSIQMPAAGQAKSEWPVFTRKIAGSARFVRPWRARLTRWDGTLPGLPPRP